MLGDSLPYSKKETKKTNKILDKLAKKKNLKVGIAHLYGVSSVKDEKWLKSQGEKEKMKKTKISKLSRRGKIGLAVLVAVMFIGVASAALIPHFGVIKTTATVDKQAVQLSADGSNWLSYNDAIEHTILDAAPSGTYCFNQWIRSSASVPVDVTFDNNDPGGITTTYWKVDTAPTIDGVIGAGEWDEAQSWTDDNGDGGTATIYAMTDTQYLYVAFDTNDEEDARLGQNVHGNDQTSVNINPSDAPWGMPCDIIFQTGSDPTAWGGMSSGDSDGWETQWKIDDIQQESLPVDLVTMTLFNPCRVTEWQIPLSSIGISLGDEIKIGGAISLPPSAANVIYPIGLDWNNVDTYASFTAGTEITSLTLQPGEQLLFYICHTFDLDIGKATYYLTTIVDATEST